MDVEISSAGRWQAERDPWRGIMAELKREKLSIALAIAVGLVLFSKFFVGPCHLRLRKTCA